ncbi:MOSC domain-containing protein [Actinokineospora auranticolor]|uniref:MOSC domain-containing protein n=1 Tax=Actinokineospora auranticolor TaxID=155976 RepID=UPI000CEBE665|nr:MOSC N-terminal beta barrel domain-containing protein [Actinokineospora auranticolor]
MITVAGLHAYPVKGCAGTALAESAVGPAGLAHDRAFMVVDASGVSRSQRRDPRLAVIHPEATADKLVLRAHSHGEITVPVDLLSPPRPVTMFGDPYRAIDQGDDAAAWFTDVLGSPSRLVRVPLDHDRVATGETPGTSGFADSSAIHLLSLESYDDLRTRLPAVPLDRFRPNIVITGVFPYAEDSLRTCRIGDVALGYTKPAIRCAVTVVNQRTGTREGPEPLRTLATYRRTPDGIAFGTKYAVTTPGTIAVGDELKPLTWA